MKIKLQESKSNIDREINKLSSELRHTVKFNCRSCGKPVCWLATSSDEYCSDCFIKVNHEQEKKKILDKIKGFVVIDIDVYSGDIERVYLSSKDGKKVELVPESGYDEDRWIELEGEEDNTD